MSEAAAKTNFRALPKRIAAAGFGALAAFCLSGIRFEGDVSPFAAAFTAGAPPQLLLPAALGSAVGALLFHEAFTALKYVGAAALIFLFRFAHDRLLHGGKDIFVFPLIAFASVLSSAAVVGIAGTGGLSGVVVMVCEALLSGACAVFSYRVFQILPSGVQMLGLSGGDTAAVLISGSVLLLSLDSFRVLGFSPAHFLAYVCVLLLSAAAGHSLGAAAGIAAGLTLGLAREELFLAYLLPAAGLTCGITANYGRLASAGAFCVLGATFIVLRGEPDAALVNMLEVAAAALLFALLPKKLLSKSTAVLRPFTGARYAAETRAVLTLRLRGKAKAVRDVADSVRAVCSMLAPAGEQGGSVADTVKAEVCGKCLKREFCWGGCAEITGRAFSALEALLTETGEIREADLPRSVAAVCRDPAAIAAGFRQAFFARNTRAAAEREVLELKSLAAAQFGSMAAVLEDAAGSAAAIGDADPYPAALARDVFTELGYRFSSLCVSADENGKMLLEVFCTGIPRQPDLNLLLDRLREKTNIDFMPPVQDEYKKEGAVLSFCERPALKTEFCKRSAAAKGENLCGDTVEAFTDGKGKFYCVLSDGMGTGRAAALDSVMTCSLFSRLLRAGFSPEIALEAVNCALMVKHGEESLATLDLLMLDLNSGQADFYKAGGAVSVVQKSGRTAVVERSSLPLGIVRETSFSHTGVSLRAGDTVLILSDGAGALSPDYFKGVLYQQREADAKTLCDTVLADALARAPAGKGDDITVACIKIRN